MNIFKLTAVLLLTFAAQGTNVALAQDHPASSIEGEAVHLFERNHAFAGEILGTPVFGSFEHAPFGARIQFRKGEKTLSLDLADRDGNYSGSVVEHDADGQATVSTSVRLGKIEKTGPADGLITLEIDGKAVLVRVFGKTFDHGHFQEPRFEADLNGKTVAFAFSGESCFGYSSNIALMIYGAYVHLSK